MKKLKKIKEEKCQPPLLRRPTPVPYFHPFSPPQGEGVVEIYSPPPSRFKKSGVRTMTVMTLLNLNDFLIITQAELCLKGTFVKAGFVFVTIFFQIMKILGEETLLIIKLNN